MNSLVIPLQQPGLTLAGWAITAALVAGCTTSDGGTTPQTSTTPAPQANQNEPLGYPATERGTVTDDYHGTVVADPYRWLEDDVRENPAVREWVDAQNRVSSNYLANLPGRDQIAARMTELWNYERTSTPRHRGGRYWYSQNDGLADQSRVFASSDPAQEGQLVLDPNTWSNDGTVALAGYWPDPTGKYVAYTVQDGGTDWRIARLHNIATGADESDELRWLKFTGLNWAADGSGFYYTRYPAPEEGEKFQSTNLNKTVYFHRLGDAQTEDQLIFSNPEHPEYGFWLDVTDDGDYLIITASIGTDDRYELFVQDLRMPNQPVRQIVKGFNYDYSLIGNRGSTLYFRTNQGAAGGAVIAFSLDAKAPDGELVATSLVIPETRQTLLGGSLVEETLILHYLQDAASRVVLTNLATGNSSDLQLPGIGAVSGFPNSQDNSETFYRFSNMTTPGHHLSTRCKQRRVSRHSSPERAIRPGRLSGSAEVLPLERRYAGAHVYCRPKNDCS